MTIPIWITREPKGEYEDDYLIHFEKPLLAIDNDDEDHKYWNSGGVALLAPPQESYGLNPGECKEWLMVDSVEFVMMQKAIKELQRLRDKYRQKIQDLKQELQSMPKVVQSINNNYPIKISKEEDRYSL